MAATKESLEEDARWVVKLKSTQDRSEREDCFRKLFSKYWKLVAVIAAQKLGNKRDAEEVAQDTFVRAFRAIDHLSEPNAFLGWLLRIATNLSTDRLRARRSMVSIDSLGDSIRPYGADSSEDHSSPFERAIESEEESSQVLHALGELPERYREVVTLRYLKGLDGKAMSQILGEPEGTVRNRLFRALEKLRARLEQMKSYKP